MGTSQDQLKPVPAGHPGQRYRGLRQARLNVRFPQMFLRAVHLPRPGWRFRRDGYVRPPLGGPGCGGQAWACPLFLPGGPQRLRGHGRPAGPSRAGDAQQPDAGGAAPYASGPASGPPRDGRRPGRVGAVRRGGMVAACATASLICACRDRRSVFRRAGPRTDTGRWVAQGVRGDRPCRGVRPGAPPGLRGREGHRVSWSSRPTRTRRARGRSRSPPPRGSSRAGSAWRRWRAAAAGPSTSGPASPAGQPACRRRSVAPIAGRCR